MEIAMYKVAIIDEKGGWAEEIQNLSIWSTRDDFKIIAVIKEETLFYIHENNIEIAFIVLYSTGIRQIEYLKKLIKECRDTYFIAICTNTEFSFVRTIFRIGVYDYLLYPLVEKEFAATFKRLEKDYYSKFINTAVLNKIDALIENIFHGGGDESIICEDIIEELHRDENKDITVKQISVENAKEKIYLDMIQKKPWLEKFIWDQKFLYNNEFIIKEKNLIMQEWKKDFAEVAGVIKKYQMLDYKLIYHIGKYIVVHVDEKLSLDDLAQNVFLNKSYISHIFKKVSGISLIDFMIDVKMDRAKILLLDGNRKIYEIAEQIGYNDVEYFRKTFKEKTGISPSEYRKKQNIFGDYT